MFSFRKKTSTPPINQIIAWLDDEDKYLDAIPHIRSLSNLKDNKHGNSFLLQALAWNHNSAAIFLIMLTRQYDLPSLSCHDTFSSSCSNALILASKTANNSAAMLILGASNITDFINATDYLGNTALHYASLMRNEALIEALQLQGADLSIENFFGKRACDYSELELTESGLNYPHGTSTFLMHHVCDFDKNYVGTQQREFSNYRWFLPHIILNLNISADHTVDKFSPSSDAILIYSNLQDCIEISFDTNKLKNILQYHLDKKVPIIDIRVYEAAAKVFIQHRLLSNTSNTQAKQSSEPFGIK